MSINISQLLQIFQILHNTIFCSMILMYYFHCVLLLKEATAKFPDLESQSRSLKRKNLQKRRSWIDNVSADLCVLSLSVSGMHPYLLFSYKRPRQKMLGSFASWIGIRNDWHTQVGHDGQCHTSWTIRRKTYTDRILQVCRISANCAVPYDNILTTVEIISPCSMVLLQD